MDAMINVKLSMDSIVYHFLHFPLVIMISHIHLNVLKYVAMDLILVSTIVMMAILIVMMDAM